MIQTCCEIPLCVTRTFIGLWQKSSHNDVLNRLADMGDEPDRRKMLERLFTFMEERGTPIVAVPTISKIAVDLFRLYHIVKDFGGMVEVCMLVSFLHCSKMIQC